MNDTPERRFAVLNFALFRANKARKEISPAYGDQKTSDGP
jgi:hypothetical protein